MRPIALNFIKRCFLLAGLKRFVLLFLITQTIAQISLAQFREKYQSAGHTNQINKASFLTPSTGFVAFENYLGYTTDSGKTYLNRNISINNTNFNGYFVNLTFGFYVTGVKAFTADSVFAIGHYGTEPSILFSSNGGNNWKVVFHKEYNPNATFLSHGITDIKFPGAGNISVAIHNEGIIRSTNAGQSWQTVLSLSDGQLRELSFPSATIGYAAGGNSIYKTVNAGLTWLKISTPDNAADIEYSNIFFISDNSGYVFDSKGRVYKTNNGGVQWSQTNDATLMPVDANDAYFTNDSTGFLVSQFSYDVYKTTNSGNVWEKCKRDKNYQYLSYGLNTLHFYNDKIGWAGGNGSYLMITTDGAAQTIPRALFKIDTTNYYQNKIVNLINFSKKNYQYKWYKNNVLISSDYNASYTHNVMDAIDTIKLIVSNGPDADTSVRYQYFTVLPLPVISSFAPTTASEGSLVIIKGAQLNNVSKVSFGGIPAASIIYVSANEIWSVVGKGNTGDVSVSTSQATVSKTGFTYVPPPTALAPQINSVEPPSGVAGSIITIKGYNFDPAPQNNVVKFGTIKAEVITSTSTSIQCKVPFGACFEHIYVLNSSTHLSGASPAQFKNLFADSSNFTFNSFAPDFGMRFSNYVVSGIRSLSTTDMDGDGKIDVLVTHIQAGIDSIRVLRNISTTDSVKLASPVVIGTSSIIARNDMFNFDMDNDGKTDIVTCDENRLVSIIRNTSVPGTISVDQPYAVNTLSTVGFTMIPEDFDNDGRVDIAVANSDYYNKLVSVARNTSSPGKLSFSANSNFRVTGGPGRIITADLDGDKRKDIILLTSTDSMVILQNTSKMGVISFDTYKPYYYGQVFVQQQPCIADYDGDGKSDIIVLEQKNYSVYLNHSTVGNIILDPHLNIPYDGGYGETSVLKLNNLSGDSKPDLPPSPSATLYRNISTPGNITTTPAVVAEPPIVGGHGYCAFGDFNNDGKEDYVANSYDDIGGPISHNIYLHINKMGKEVPFTLCERSTNYYLNADFIGTSYQWQLDSGNGFRNMQDNAFVKGSTSGQLIFSNVPITWSGYRFRCLAGSDKSSVFKLTVNKSPQISVSITVSDTVICDGKTRAIFTAHPASPPDSGKSYVYKWFANDLPAGTSYVPEWYLPLYSSDQSRINLVLSTTDACKNEITDTSNYITITVHQKLSRPGNVEGPKKVSTGTGYKYLYTVPKPATAVEYYTWTSVYGYAINLPQTTKDPQVLVSWKDEEAGNTDMICVTATNTCGTSKENCSSNITLPLELLNFQVSSQGSSNVLKWSTENTSEMAVFEIQRSIDGSVFTKIGELPVKNSITLSNYMFIDNEPMSGTNYYRLRIVAKSGSITYSPIRSIKNVQLFTVQVTPNPVLNRLLSFTTASAEQLNAQAVIMDVAGNKILNKDILINAGYGKYEINVTSLSRGVYVLKIITNKHSVQKKFIIN